MRRHSPQRYGFAIASTVFFLSFSTVARPISSSPADEPIFFLYRSIDFNAQEKPDEELFYRAMCGYYQLRHTQKLSEKEILTLIDYRKSGNEERLWVIDLKHKKLLHYSLVAHGRNSGEIYAGKFSNTIGSNKSSLGFYITGNTYTGRHGTSLKLYGVEKGINDRAEARAIVMHGAEYVSRTYIKETGRLGRSLGCPAVPMDVHKEIISDLAGGTCLFIYYPDGEYLAKTAFRPDTAAGQVTAWREAAGVD